MSHLTALAEAQADERVRRAFDEENAYWQTPETRMRAIANRVYLGRIARVRRDPGPVMDAGSVTLVRASGPVTLTTPSTPVPVGTQYETWETS